MHCDPALLALLQARLDAFQRTAATRAGLRPAAVAVTVVDSAFGADLPELPEYDTWSPLAALLLTRRAAHLRNHPGQWALPGGRVEPGETVIDTALREMHEEVGVDLPADRVLGVLDDFETRSGFAMTPVVVWGGPALPTQHDPGEVASVHRIPVTEFLRDDAPQLETLAGSDQPVLRMPVGSQTIAAPTAAILYQFREVCLLGRDTRVAHYEQPPFAWR